jgi:hypothetical protein
MKKYYYQFTTGLILSTAQDIHFSREGYAIDKDTPDNTESCINGELSTSLDSVPRKVEDITFRSRDIVISWEENI